MKTAIVKNTKHSIEHINYSDCYIHPLNQWIIVIYVIIPPLVWATCIPTPFLWIKTSLSLSLPIGVIGVISVWPLPEVRNWFRKQILNENVHISILKKNMECFNHHKKCFVTKKNSEKAKHTEICPSFDGNASKT